MDKPYYRYFYLYKFFETDEYRKQFLDGMLYCNTANWFHNAEMQKVGVVDEFENADPKNYRDNQGFISYHREHYNLFCLSTIWLDENGIVTEFDKSNINNFGNYGVFIMNAPKFRDIICNSLALNPMVKVCYGNPIQYFSYKNRDSIQRWNIWRKFDSYKPQQEFRIAFLNTEDTVLRYYLFDNLSNIVATIPNKQEFFNNIHVGQHIFSDINIRPIK